MEAPIFSFKTKDQSNTIINVDSDCTLDSVRNRIIDGTFKAFGLLGILPLIVTIIKWIEHGYYWLSITLILVYCFLILFIVIKPQIPVIWKGNIGFIILFSMGTIYTALFGLSGGGIWIYFTLCVLSTAIFGVWRGLITVFMCLTVILVIAFAMSYGFIPFNPEIVLNSKSLLSWTIGASFFVLLAMIMVISHGILQEYLLSQTDKLMQSNKRLEAEISDRKRAEAKKLELEGRLIQAQRLESIGRLAGGIAHDFNNLLTGIIGNIALAKLDTNLDDPLYDTLNEMEKAADSSANLTKQLLAFSRKQIIQLKVVNLNKILASIKTMLKKTVGEDIDFEVLLDSDISNIKADSGQLEQITLNLVVNARDALASGGMIKISTSTIEISEKYCESNPDALPGNYVLLEVEDDGCGMDDDTMKLIFEPFFTTKEKHKGTGLGLSTVYGIVSQHLGFIEIESVLTKGTTFKVYLPAFDGAEDSIFEQNDKQNLLSGSETIMMVEDETIVRELNKKVLLKLGYKVIVAEDGQQGFLRGKDRLQDIDLLLTDVVMPNMNGKELADKLLEIKPKLKVLFTSGYTDDAIVNEGVLEDGVNFISKPYTPFELAAQIRDILDS